MPTFFSLSRSLALGVFCLSLLFGPTIGFGADNKLNLNTATAAQLETLKGIGPEIANRILDYKKDQGNFKSVDELGNVKGIGDKKLAELKEMIMVKKSKKK